METIGYKYLAMKKHINQPKDGPVSHMIMERKSFSKNNNLIMAYSP